MTADKTVGASFAVTSVITSCRPITAPGTYAVTGQISSSDTCLDIHDTHGVTIDCGGQTVGGSPALVMTNVDGFSIKNCHFVPTASFYLANLLHVSNGTFQHDTFGSAPVNVVHAADVRIDQNTFNASYWQSYSHRVVLSSNTLVSSARGSAFAGAMIGSTFGSDNQFVGNVMDGKWAGSGQTETDDGVVIGDESGDVVSGNTISNVFDCGIETTGVIANATISNNNITRTGFCGIGGWYWNSLKASTISGNVATGVPRLFHFFRIFGLRPARFDSLHEMPADAAVYFNDNVFDGNRLVNPSTQATSSSIIRVYDQLDYSGSVSSVIPGERAPGSSDFILSNNIFRNNDFGHTLLAPDFGAPVVPGLVPARGVAVSSPKLAAASRIRSLVSDCGYAAGGLPTRSSSERSARESCARGPSGPRRRPGASGNVDRHARAGLRPGQSFQELRFGSTFRLAPILDQRHPRRLLRSPGDDRGRRVASPCRRQPGASRCPALWPGDLRDDGGGVAAVGADGSAA